MAELSPWGSFFATTGAEDGAGARSGEEVCNYLEQKTNSLRTFCSYHLIAFKNISKYFHLTVDDLGDSDCVPRGPPRGASVEVAQVHADPAVRLHL